MKRKSNPWVSLIALLLLALTLALTLTGCDATAEAAEPENPPRFIVEKAEDNTLGPDIRVITDTETGVQYLFFQSGYAGGLTKLEPAPESEEAK